ncbi:hypothetical protein [Paracoccus versutus]|uniref:hypothetical protein n=1 Tax=Paracoccus versutus TaxID=34007 RepID=UPI0015F02434|nr:hypothetical protein [Paracoccus versutus]
MDRRRLHSLARRPDQGRHGGKMQRKPEEPPEGAPVGPPQPQARPAQQPHGKQQECQRRKVFPRRGGGHHLFQRNRGIARHQADAGCQHQPGRNDAKRDGKVAEPAGSRPDLKSLSQSFVLSPIRPAVAGRSVPTCIASVLSRLEVDPPVAQRPVEPKKQPLAVLLKRGGIAPALPIGR